MSEGRTEIPINRVKDEILAFLQDGRRSTAQIKKILQKKKEQGGLYDYFHENMIDQQWFPTHIMKEKKKMHDLRIDRLVDIAQKVIEITKDKEFALDLLAITPWNQWRFLIKSMD